VRSRILIEHDRDQGNEGSAQAEGSPGRGCRVSGLSDLLPDWLLPPEGKQHARNARKEALLAMKSVIDSAIARQEAGPAPRRTAQRVEID
jgi:hypothetical protein